MAPTLAFIDRAGENEALKSVKHSDDPRDPATSVLERDEDTLVEIFVEREGDTFFSS